MINKIRLHLRRYIFVAAMLFLAVAANACALRYGYLSKLLLAQRAAEVFGAGQSGYAQVSAYLPITGQATEDNVLRFRRTLEEKYAEIAMEATGGGRLYADAYCGEGSVNVTGAKGSYSVSAFGVGGDFFLFHPLFLRSGGYISEYDLMHDRVVLVEELAWQLFGGIDLAGMSVIIGDKPYLIAGVVARETDFASAAAYPQDAGMFMAYDALSELTGCGISWYEAVGADPISGFVLDCLETSFPTAECVENSSRFSIEVSWKTLRTYAERGMAPGSVSYPYWESAARLIQSHLAILLLFIIICAVPPAVTLIVICVIFLRRSLRKGMAYIPVLVEKSREKRYDKKVADSACPTKMPCKKTRKG